VSASEAILDGGLRRPCAGQPLLNLATMRGVPAAVLERIGCSNFEAAGTGAGFCGGRLCHFNYESLGLRCLQ
jgi:hypothetical protein